MDYAIGIDLGGSSVKAVAMTLEGRTLAQSNVGFDSEMKLDWAERIRGVCAELQSRAGASPANPGPGKTPVLRALGLAAPGLAARDGRSIAYMPGRLQGLEGLDWTSFLHSDRPVPVLNDAHAALLGESWLGAARGFDNVIMLTLGTGVGGAAIVDGRLLRGHMGRAGHLGHACLDIDGPPDCAGTPGSLEVAIGNCTIAARTRGRFQSTHELVAAHLAGDAEATTLWLKSVRALACAVASFVNILDPEAVIIGGGIAQSGPTLFEPLENFLGKVEWRPGGQCVKVFPAQLGEFAGACGAAWNAIQGSD